MRRLREQLGLSQEALGFAAELHRTYISQLERGLKSPSLSTMRRICDGLHITMTRMMSLVERETGTGEKHRSRGHP